MTAGERKRFESMIPKKRGGYNNYNNDYGGGAGRGEDDPMTVEWTKWPRSGRSESCLLATSARPEGSVSTARSRVTSPSNAQILPK